MSRRQFRFSKKLGSALAVLLVALVSSYFENPSKTTGPSPESGNKSLVLTKHAKCRMGCRYLSQSEVEDVIDNGKVNPRKSNPQKKPCPVFAKEKITKDKQRARVVFADCPTQRKVITVIDLGQNHYCKCK